MRAFRLWSAVRPTADAMRAALLRPVPLAILAAACGGRPSDPPEPARTRSAVAYPQPPAVFHAEPAGPDTLEISWQTNGPVLVESVFLQPGREILQGDTVALGKDSLVGLQIEMVTLQLSLARASGSSESEISRLEDRLADLEAGSRLALVAPAPGILAWTSAAPGTACPPGKPCAGIAMLPESVFVLRAPEGALVHEWPESGNGAALVHAARDSAVYSGIAVPGGFVFDGSLGLPRGAILDSGLESFVISAGGDTIGIERLCTAGENVTVIPEEPLDGGVLVWSGGMEEWNE